MKCTHFYNPYHKPFTKCGSSKHTQNRRQQDRQYNHKLNPAVRPRNLCPHGKAGSITHFEGVSVTLLIKHAKHLTLPYFFTLSQTARFSEKKKMNINVCFDFLHNFCLKHISF